MRIEFSDEGIQELLHNVGESVCAEHAQRIQSKCGDGYKSDVFRGNFLTMASVYTFDEDPDEILRHLQ